MKKYSLYILVLIIVLPGFYACSGNNKNNGFKNQIIADKWANLKKIDIQIPADINGEAVLTRNFYFIIDGSGSMNDRPEGNCGGNQKFSSKIAGAKWAIDQFLKQIPEDVNIGMYLFDKKGARETVPLDINNRDEFLNAVNSITASGGTPLYKSIVEGTDRLVEKFKEQLGYGEFRLVVVTDGIADNIPDAAFYAAERGIPIYTIGLCVDTGHPLRYFSVSYKAADNFHELTAGLKETLAELPVFDPGEFKDSGAE